MIYEDYLYNKGEDLDHCPLCKNKFIEGEEVRMIDLPKGPFVIVHRQCYGNSCKIIKGKKSKDMGSSTEELLQSDNKLWRYMDLAKFISMLKSSALYFSSPDCFEDIYEGAHGELKNKKAWDDFYMSYARASIVTAPDNCWHKIDMDILEENAKNLVEQISKTWKKGVFINCWYHSEFESEAMWKMYAVNVQNAIAIQTTCGELERQMGKKATIKTVQYIDYSTQFVGPNEEFWHKRKSFEYEKEVRAIIHNFEHGDEFGINVQVNLHELIKCVYISPYAPIWFYDVVADVIGRYGYNFNISMSNMAETPF